MTICNIQYVQPLDYDGKPNGAVAWICPQMRRAGRLLMTDLATDVAVAHLLPKSFEADFHEVAELIGSSPEMRVTFPYDTKARRMASMHDEMMMGA